MPISDWTITCHITRESSPAIRASSLPAATRISGRPESSIASFSQRGRENHNSLTRDCEPSQFTSSARLSVGRMEEFWRRLNAVQCSSMGIISGSENSRYQYHAPDPAVPALRSARGFRALDYLSPDDAIPALPISFRRCRRAAARTLNVRSGRSTKAIAARPVAPP